MIPILNDSDEGKLAIASRGDLAMSRRSRAGLSVARLAPAGWLGEEKNN